MKIVTMIPKFALHQVRAIFSGGPARLLPEGSLAPDFSVADETGTTHRLSQYRGRFVVLYWFIRASTPG